ncbi:MAG: collagen-like protein [Methylotenera sp.]|nr:collagen-like protein [Oligoflexia bacterium]
MLKRNSISKAVVLALSISTVSLLAQPSAFAVSTSQLTDKLNRLTTEANTDEAKLNSPSSGPKGATGSVGAVGLAGPQGAQGPIGSVGPQGDTGPQGLPGPQGPKGADAPYTGTAGPKGDVGPTGPAGPVGIKGTLNSVKGPQGGVGQTGDPGPTGLQGARGLTGPQGSKGNHGQNGAGVSNPIRFCTCLRTIYNFELDLVNVNSAGVATSTSIRTYDPYYYNTTLEARRDCQKDMEGCGAGTYYRSNSAKPGITETGNTPPQGQE